MSLALRDELDDWYYKLISAPKEVPDRRLYHYTNVQSFSSILASNQFWMTSYKYLDDPTEFVYSDKVITETLGLKESKFRPKEYALIRQYLGYERRLSTDVSPFVLSFSEECDSLYQWRAYADDGNGVNIGIEPPEDGTRYYRNLSKVVYDPSLQADMMREIVDGYLQIRNRNHSEGMDELNATFVLYQAIMHMRVRFKHPAYAIEKEWRYANYPGYPFTHHRWIRRGLVEYFAEGAIRDENTRLPIREIYLGSRINEQAGRNAVETLLTQHGYDLEQVKVLKSDVPLG